MLSQGLQKKKEITQILIREAVRPMHLLNYNFVLKNINEN